ncbi:hypothetical protein TREES_T100008578 [Tupaia chinensis]|uniref:Secreted protein n=1 Tax=Tupaia chinensis TaxID=246437 RepID=L9L3I7_TUPCH|nr:hypothetical protein TREES_T100008578 [Tupaia chinensis]
MLSTWTLLVLVSQLRGYRILGAHPHSASTALQLLPPTHPPTRASKSCVDTKELGLPLGKSPEEAPLAGIGSACTEVAFHPELLLAAGFKGLTGQLRSLPYPVKFASCCLITSDPYPEAFALSGPSAWMLPIPASA